MFSAGTHSRALPMNDEQYDDDIEEHDDTVIATALRWSLLGFVIIASVIAAAVFLLTRPVAPTPIKETALADVQVRRSSEVQMPEVYFTDVTVSAGISFRHENGARGRKLLPETMGGGCAFFDFDNDGDQDLLLVNSQRWPWDDLKGSSPVDVATLALYENDGKGSFKDITRTAGLAVSIYGMGAAVGDFDNDGFDDLYISAVGENRLFRNERDGTFRDVTQTAGVAGSDDQWGCSCGWFDYDNDGDLDLFVCNYVSWSREKDESQDFQLTGGGRAYGRPQNFEGTFPYLFRNEGNGQFTEVAGPAGLQRRNPATQVPMAKSLGVVFADFDMDGLIDLVVANDTVQNFLFHNRGDGTFEEIGAAAGVAYDTSGNARGAMGIDAACFRNNAAMGIAIGNFANEMTALYVSKGNEMQFMDEAISSGLGPNTRLELTFGVFFFDYDLDGRLDLFAANGHLEEDINRVQPSQHYEQSPQLFWNCGDQQDTEFMPVPQQYCGADLLKPMVGRGAGFADIDSDGDLDVLIMGVGQEPRLLRNDLQLENNWIRFRLIGTKCNRNAIGSWIELPLDNNTIRRQVMPTRSYLSQCEQPVTIGLGQLDANQLDQLKLAIVHWPDGTEQAVDLSGLNRSYDVRQE